MRWFVLGGTGRTGRAVVEVALRRGHEVTAFVRSPGKVAPQERLTVTAGDPRDVGGLRAAMAGHDAVFSAIGAPVQDALRPGTLHTECATAAVAAMVSAGVPRLALVSAAVLFPEPSGFPYGLVRWLLRHLARDLSTMEAVVAGSDLAWTVARPPRLVAGDDARYRAAVGALPPDGRSVSFRALATFLVDAVERETYLGEVVGVAR